MKFSMFGQHSSASTGGIAIQHTMQIANIIVIVCRKFGATPPYDRCWRGVVTVLQVCEQIFSVTLQFVHIDISSLVFARASRYALRYYDSCTCATLLEEIGHFCPLLHISCLNIDAFWTLTFWLLTCEW